MRIIEADLAQGIHIAIRPSVGQLMQGEMWQETLDGQIDGEIGVISFTQEDVIRKLAAIIAEVRIGGVDA